MSERRATNRPAAQRGGAVPPPVNIRTGPPVRKMLPYAALVAVVGTLALLLRSPRYENIGALVATILALGTVAYIAMGHRSALAEDDKLRVAVLLVPLLVVGAAAAPLVLTIYPMPPSAEVSLDAVDAVRTANVSRGKDLWLSVHAASPRDATGNPDYTIQVINPAGASERVAGRLRIERGMLVERHGLAAKAPAALRIELRGASSSVGLPVIVRIHSRPVPSVMLFGACAVLLLLVLAVDVTLNKRGMEPSFAASLCVPIVAVAYLQFRVTGGESALLDLLAAGVLGVVVGGLGGEGLARLGRVMGR